MRIGRARYRIRPATSVVCLALVLASCGNASELPDGDAIGDPTLSASPTATDGGPPTPGDDPTSPSPRPRPGSSRQPGGSPQPTAEPSYADAAAVGAMARTYLRASPARRLVVEIDYVRDRAPSQVALDHLASILRRELRKPDGIVIERGDRLSAARSRYSLEDLVALERDHRDRSSSGSTATMYVLYLNGEYSEGSAIGLAFRASAAAIFVDQVRSAATALVQATAIERAVLTHEAGHLLALVNLGYRSPHDREDPDHPHHSRYRDSVMFWAVEDISVAAILNGGPPDDFDRFDRDDLALLRGD